jgi:hypothetical protein
MGYHGNRVVRIRVRQFSVWYPAMGVAWMRIDLQTSSTAYNHARKSCHILTYLMAVITGSLLMQLDLSLICLIAATVNWMCSPWTGKGGGIKLGNGWGI